LNNFEAFYRHFERKWEAFIKITRLFEDIFREMEALTRNLRIFQRLRGFLKTYSMELGLIFGIKRQKSAIVQKIRNTFFRELK
jgi:hypothetical protein